MLGLHGERSATDLRVAERIRTTGMRHHDGWKAVLGALALLVGLSSGCIPEKVEQKKREFKAIKRDLAAAKESVKSTVQKTAQSAKAGVAKLDQKLPELEQEAREGLQSAQEGLREKSNQVVETVRDTLQRAHQKIDQTVEEASR
jgi:outer membrane murein-binding lipoprotein Lpp